MPVKIFSSRRLQIWLASELVFNELNDSQGEQQGPSEFSVSGALIERNRQAVNCLQARKGSLRTDLPLRTLNLDWEEETDIISLSVWQLVTEALADGHMWIWCSKVWHKAELLDTAAL